MEWFVVDRCSRSLPAEEICVKWINMILVTEKPESGRENTPGWKRLTADVSNYV